MLPWLSKLLCIGVEFNPFRQFVSEVFCSPHKLVLVFELMENDLRKLRAEQSKDGRRVSLLILDSLLDGNCIIVSPLSELTGSLSSYPGT